MKFKKSLKLLVAGLVISPLIWVVYTSVEPLFGTVKVISTLKTDVTADLASNTSLFLQPVIDTIDSVHAASGSPDSPENHGAVGDDSTDDTTAIQAAFDGSSTVICINGTYRASGLSLTVVASPKHIVGTGTITLIDSSPDSELLEILGSFNTIEGISLKGNKSSPPTGQTGSPLVVTGNDNLIKSVKFYDADNSHATTTNQDNVIVDGDRNKLIDCYSEGSSYSGYANHGSDNQYINCMFRRGATPSTITRSFNGSGGAVKMGTTLLIDGFNSDDEIVLDWASENGAALMETIIITNSVVRSVDGQALKLAHVRNAIISNSHLEALQSSQEGLSFGERVYNVSIVNTLISAGPGNINSNSHIQGFGAGNKHRTLNSLSLDTVTIGGTGKNPDQNWDNRAIDVRTFKFTMVNSKVNGVRSRILEIYPEETGVLEVRTSAPPTASGTQNIYIVGSGSQSALWAAIPLHTLAWDTGSWNFEEPASHGADDTSTNNATTMTDSTMSAIWVADQFNGWTVENLTDVSADGLTVASGTVTDTTTTTIVVASLTGGTDNDWDSGDLYKVTPPNEYTELKFDTRVYNEDNAVDDWLMFVNDDDGWIVIPDDLMGIDVHDNLMTGFADSATLFGIDAGSAVHQDRFLRKSNLISWYNNKLVNLGSGGATQEASSSVIQPVFQQKGPGLWWSAAVPTTGLWVDGDRVDRVPATVGSPVGWIQNADGVPSFTALPNL